MTAFAALRRRRLIVLALGLGLEVAAMAVLALAPPATGTPGAVGVGVAVLAAVAGGPRVGAVVAVGGWAAFFAMVASTELSALLALPVWVVAAYVVGGLTCALVTAERDLAERDLERQELRRLGTLKSQFIALASHELRSPAAAVSGISATLHARGDQLPPETVAQLRAALYEQSERLRTLIDQLLDLSRLEAKSIAIRPEPVPVREEVDRMLRLFAPEQQSRVEVDVPADLVANVDRHAFERIVGNLVTNAVRYGEPPVTIGAEQRDRHFRLTVEDRGEGVAPEFVAQLFDSFARGVRSRRDHAGSTGLGLAIARAYAHAHGGDVLYENADPHGARFQLVLPRSLPADAGDDPPR